MRIARHLGHGATVARHSLNPFFAVNAGTRTAQLGYVSLYRSSDAGREDFLPILLHADHGPAIDGGRIEGLV